mgnify:CR=1 FL=1
MSASIPGLIVTGVKMYSNKHYKKYPNLKPWVGERFGDNSARKLLVIGESHYLPNDSIAAKDSEKWYISNQENLSEIEKTWIDTSGIIRDNIPMNFPNKSHWIYRNVAKEINKIFLGYENSAEALNHLAFMNYFQRPAESEGGSIHVRALDKKMSEMVVKDVVETLQPELVVFCSSKAGGFGASVVQKLGLKCTVAPHPSCQWWNRKAKKYDGYGRDIIPKFLAKNRWAEFT